jgi:hypothetical protein
VDIQVSLLVTCEPSRGQLAMLTLSSSFLIAEITPIAFATIGWRYYVVFASTNFLLILPCKHDKAA